MSLPIHTPIDTPTIAHAPQLLERVRHFVDSHLIPTEPQLYRGGDIAQAELRGLQRAAKDRGLWALPVPRELGGQGMSLADFLPISEVEGRSQFGPVALGSDTLLDVLMLHRHGSAQLRQHYLPGLVDGSLVPSYAMTEPGIAGSDPSGIRTRATRGRWHWVISGRKWFTSRAAEASFTTVLCRTEPFGKRNSEAFSLFLVPTNARGYTPVRPLPILGHMGGHWEVQYDDVEVDDEAMLGQRGRGYLIVRERLALGRTLRCMRWIGQAQRAFDLMCDRLCSRRAFDGLLADKQLLQQHVFDAFLDISTARGLVSTAVQALEGGADTAVPVSVAKVAASRALCRTVDRAIQVFGAEGLTEDTPLSVMYRDARSTRIYDGPDEVHVELVGRLLLQRRKDRQLVETVGHASN
jgi:acyl-CoA dehydrogenase